MYYIVASSDSRRNIGRTATPKRAYSISWRHRHQQLIGVHVCAQGEYPRSKSSTMHAHRRNADGTASSWMDGKLFQLQFPNRHFLFCYVYIWTGEHWTHTPKTSTTLVSNVYARWTQAMEIVVHIYMKYVFLFTTPRAKYTHYGLFINDRVELSVELSWRWAAACARKTIFLCIKLWSNFSYSSLTSSSSITLAIKLRSTCTRQISKSNVQYVVFLCVIRNGVTGYGDEMWNQNSLDSRESTTRHLRGVDFWRYESALNWWISSNGKQTLFLRHVLNQCTWKFTGCGLFIVHWAINGITFWYSCHWNT